jgi:hypothetical protein
VEAVRLASKLLARFDEVVDSALADIEVGPLNLVDVRAA